ncbi:MAG: hypothetical protein DMF56_24945 [Acidobacteria bacterium]|nr:MAG: hypothetical protein DMF56_24945 [Acidobacteriota bacterium]
MKTLSTDVSMVFAHTHDHIVNADAPGVPRPGLQISAKPGHVVSSYVDLLSKIAALQYHNPRFRFLFRGQSRDHVLNLQGQPGVHSSLYPSILRPSGTKDRRSELRDRFTRLSCLEDELKKRLVAEEIHHDRIIRWAILQHYETVPTPLLDVTLSLQVAVSFALAEDPSAGYLFALAVPHLSGPVSVSIESQTQVIDLSQACPPEALRPHFQSGLLIGDYPVVGAVDTSHGGRGLIGNNFACRLFAKFHLTNCVSWAKEGWVPTSPDILFPNKIDTWHLALDGLAAIP